MPAQTLSYQRLSPTSVQVRAALRRSEFGFLAASISLMLLAAMSMLLAPALVSGIIQAILRKYMTELPFSGWTLFLLLCAALTPLLFWLESRTHGDFFTDEMRSQGQCTSDRPASYGEWEFRRSGATLAAYVELALWGPRLWRENHAKLTYRRKIGLLDLSRATAILCGLLDTRESVCVTDLLLGGEAIDTVRRNLFHLKLLEWVDLSSDGKRVWMLSDRRKQIERIQPRA